MQIAGYEVREEIGRGQHAVVFDAVHLASGRPCALKLLHLPADLSPAERQERKARFLREGEILSRLRHPSLVEIYEVGETGPIEDLRLGVSASGLFLAMERLRGRTLRERLRSGGPLTEEAAVAVLRPLLDALAAVHRAGIVHRDIKPDNLWLPLDGGVKLMDFGIARDQADPTLTASGTLMGSPAYMSPEQVRGEPVQASSDCFAVGIVLVEMVTGRRPFDPDDESQATVSSMLTRILQQPPHPTRLAMVSGPLRAFCLALLEKEPDRRPADAGAALALFEHTRRGAWTLPPPDPALLETTLLFPAPPPRPGPAPPPSPAGPDGTRFPFPVRAFAWGIVTGLIGVALVLWAASRSPLPRPTQAAPGPTIVEPAVPAPLPEAPAPAPAATEPSSSTRPVRIEPADGQASTGPPPTLADPGPTPSLPIPTGIDGPAVVPPATPPVLPEPSEPPPAPPMLRLRLYIGLSGEVEQVEIEQSSGDPAFDHHTVSRVRATRFRPRFENGVETPYILVQTYPRPGP